MIAQALVLSLLVVAGASLRFFQGGRSGVLYAWLLAGLLLFGVMALREDRADWSVIVIALSVVTVMVPALLERLAKWAFSRGSIIAAVRLNAWRATLMPGARLGEQQAILRALEFFERDGVDASLAYLRELDARVVNPSTHAVIQEQLVALLFQAGRFEEGIRAFKSEFHPGYAALRPALALGLLRAYGECGDLDSAGGVLRMLEQTVVGSDPRARQFLGQARLTYLAYAGASASVEQVLADGGGEAFGVSAAGAQLYRGIARARMGDREGAKAALQDVANQARRRDYQILNAADIALEGLGSTQAWAPGDATADAETLEAVVERIKTHARPEVEMRAVAWPVVPTGVAIAFLVIYGLFVAWGQGIEAMTQLGAVAWTSATPPAALASWWSVWTAGWLHTDPLVLTLNAYAIWTTGKLVEGRLGAVGFALVLVLGSAMAHVTALLIASSHVMMFWGASWMALVSLGAALPIGIRAAKMIPGNRARRWYVIVGVFVSALSLTVLGMVGVWPAVGSVAVAFGVGVAATARPPRPRAAHPGAVRGQLLRVALTVVLAVTGLGWGVAWSATANAPQAGMLDGEACEYRGLTFPGGLRTFVETEGALSVFGMPRIADGRVDAFALRAGQLVQLAVLDPQPPGALSRGEDGAAPAVFDALLPGFAGEFTVTRAVTPAWLEALAHPEIPTASWTLRSGGAPVGEVWLRTAYRGGPVIVLAGPPEILRRHGALYRRMLEEVRTQAEVGDACR